MTKSDLPDLDDAPSDGAVIIKRALLAFGGGIVLIFLAGVFAGYTSVVIEHGGPGLVDAAILSAMLLAIVAAGFGIWRFWPHGDDEPEAPRVKSARMILIASVIVSFPIGILMGLSDDGATGLFSNGPINPIIALMTIAAWLIPVPLLTWLWWRRVDEHEANAYRDGGFIAIHAYFFIAPIWWVGTRAGWFPPQDPMLVFLAVCIVWSIVSIVKKYR